MSREERLPIVDASSSSGEDEARPVVRRRSTRDTELAVPKDAGCCAPTSTPHRFLALVFMCLLGFGSYFCYDNPGALQDVFQKELNLNATEFTFIYSIYSWPNIVLCFVGGFLIDRVFGIRLGTIIYMLIVLLGQLIFATGGLLGKFWLMIVGRFVFGIGAESLAVAQNSYAVLWFKGKELNMVFGLQLSVARFGSTVNFWIMQPVYNYVSKSYSGYTGLGVTLFLAASTCVMSLLCTLILGWMDKRAERILKRNNNPGGEIAKLSDIMTFRLDFWMVSVVCVAYYVAIFPFVALGQAFFTSNFHLTPEQANNVNSIVYLISAIASPLFGFIIDRVGRNVSWVFVATIATLVSHLLLTFSQLNPYIGMSIMGLSYSMLAASLWPLVALIVPEYQLGTAYGFCQSVQNLGLAVVTIVAGLIVDSSGGSHFWLQLLFILFLLISLLATCAIWAYDRKYQGNLNMSPAQRATYHTSILTKRGTTDRRPLLGN
ncbi:lysosomal dipeptide transporter MFSD1 isoform X1 [Drosophila virilis]|uniref:lysosomal dipeptide transporter MFSD1 isoform X1 n=1 Tax=Drosophila virilis TaxID=7244 RepID=UPI001396335E|nr:major facilitator superfamily domain-containing protein 1 isoform X1 [Drosophila virilis]XP_032294653.1 major facilitator superfamily domain-containing protein 1 isoform X1 [Drosophila virilis]